MAKRKSRKGGSTANSKETTPHISEHEGTPEPSSKRNKRKPVTESDPESSPEPPSKKKKGPKSSSDLCAEYSVQDVELEYTDADYQNLTTYNLFVRLIRPQISAANPKFIPASKMNQIMEAKWREFSESNPFTKDGKEEVDEDDDDGDDDEDDDNDEEDENVDDEEENKEIYGDSSDDVNGEDNEDNTEEYEKSVSSTEEEEPKDEPKKRGGLKIKLSLNSSGTRKSTRDRKTPKKLDDEVEKFFDSEEDSLEDQPKRKSSKKKASSSDGDFESDDSVPKKKKKKSAAASKSSAKKKKQILDSSASSLDTSSTSDVDSDDSDRRRRGRKAKKPEPVKPVIPGERRSERSRRSGVDSSLKEMTDREFERMLKKQEEKIAKKEKKKKKQMKKKNSIKGKKGGWQDENDQKSGEESDHCWYCAICKDGGDLMLCDGCPKSFHQKCLKLETIPEGEWKCPICMGEEISGLSDDDDEEEEGGGHDPFCKECKGDGDLLLCDFCPGAYHLNCLNPPLKEVPEGEWKCPRCLVAETPLKESVTRILTWRWINVKNSKDAEFDHTSSPRKKSDLERKMSEGNENRDDKDKDDVPQKRPERQLFVKYRFYSYWDCEWIPEMALEVHQKNTWTRFKSKWDQDEPPTLEDFGSVRHYKKNKNDDPFDLDGRFYRWGVKPEYLQIHRVLAHEKENSKMNKYLIKWRDLAYEESTFEAEDDLPEGIQDWQKHVDKYWARRKEKEKEAKEKDKKKDNNKKDKANKKKEWKKKLEVQPKYIDDTGGKLHPYQLEGFNWMRFSWAQDTNVILADEMGLGKTIQAITFLRGLFVEGLAPGPFLISVPLSTLANWEREFEFWAPEMYVVSYIGTRENRAIIREREFCYKEGAFNNTYRPEKMKDGYQIKFDVLLTSYEMVNMDKATLKAIRYSVLVIDEAHRLKSSQSLFFRTMSEYKIDYQLLLTGTPLQNNLDELFNLLNFLEPGKFNDMQQFLQTFEDISKEEQVKALHEMLAPHMLRRLKMDVLKDIPDKCEMIVRVELSAMQKKYYKHILTKNYTALNVKGHGNQTSLINIMMDLRKCCNHPYLFPTADQEAPMGKHGAYEGEALTKAAGKLELLDKMLCVLKRDGHRVLIFSQMTRVLDILEDFMDHHNYNYERIDGSVTGGMRQERIDRFNDPESSAFAFLLSTKAGGLGINLATADTVIIYDMDWNPHNDIQAFSRAHRIGQKNKVMIYRFVSCNSVEEKMTQVCKQKMMLSELVIAKGGAEKKESLSKQEVNDILKFGAENLFQDTEEGRVTYDDAAVEKLLNREQAGEAEKAFGMNEYLRSFNVATYKIKEGPVEEEEEEEEEEVAPSKSNTPISMNVDDEDANYWSRVLGDSYAEHMQAFEKEQADIERSLGKGKRVRKQINYAETALMSFMSEKDKKKMMNVEVLEEDEDGDEEYMSDYKPEGDSTSSEEDVEIDENLLDAEERKNAEAARQKKQFAKEQKELKKARDKLKAEREKQKATETLPPLLAKVNGQIEVLGFTPRQRRAFLDAVMRFGMPPDDCYRSQWLVRDLRMKSERVFKAYMSLFMRHLCEPIADDAEKFADGVPREGLSRQHVLTRIGMIALIRRKVSEYEKKNGVFSMQEFDKTAKKSSKMLKMNNTAKDDKVTDKDGSPQKDLSKKIDNGAEKNRDETEKEKESVDSKSTEDNNKVKTSSEKTSNGDNEKTEGTADGTKSAECNEKSKTADKENQEEAINGQKESDISEEKSTNVKDSKEEDTIGKEQTNEIEPNLDSKEKSSEADKDTSENQSNDKSKRKSIEENDSNKTEGKSSSTDNKQNGENTELGKSPDNEEGNCQEKSNMQQSEDTAQKSEEKMDTTESSKENDKNINTSENKEKDHQGEASKKDEKKDDASPVEKDKSDESAKEKKDQGPVMYNGFKVKTLAEIQTELRCRLWVSDGGFTELHAVWNHEESLLMPGKEYEMWHRRHDFWLLAGVITHGYRHWQDIMNDPRFAILNKAFRPEADRLKRAAFLNRRFQLLEQALVIEEQLRKAAIENVSHFKAAIEEVKENQGGDAGADLLSQVDQFAANLRKISHGLQVNGPPPDAKVHKAISTLSGLITDIRQITYKTMPSTLAMTEHGAQTAKISMLAKQMQKDAAARKVISID